MDRWRSIDRGRGLAYVAPFATRTPFFRKCSPTMFTFLLVVHAIIAALLVTVILMQKSEGGGLTTGGSPSGLMSARGAADFLTRATAILAGLFIAMSIALAVIAANRGGSSIDTSLARPTTPPPAVSGPANPAADPVGNLTGAPVADNGAVPLAR